MNTNKNDNKRIIKVLIIDDEEGIRVGIKRVLQNFILDVHDFDQKISFEIETASNLEKFIEVNQNKNFDIYIIDYLLPDGSGIDILNLINNTESNLQIKIPIMITAYSDISLTIEATKNGAFDFIIKPFGPSEIKASIKKAIDYLLL
ncbi:MAG: response regulator [Oligoflexia bacterium]|nr:response regulator [Oligoflexia bacterium]